MAVKNISLPTLYARNSSGGIQEWRIIIDKDTFYTEEGLHGGKITTSKPTICIRKNIGRSNETTAQEQAQLEAKAKWQKKIDAGYFEDIKRIDEDTFFEPMLAHKYEDYKDELVFPVYAQPKLDGIRCVARKTGLWSRNGKKFVSCPHIEKALKPIFDAFPNAIWDGELYCDKLANDFNKICSLVKRSKPSAQDLKDAERSIQYWCYDLPSVGGEFSYRNERLENLIELHGLAPTIQWLDTQECASQAELDVWYERWLAKGYEGQIIRLDGRYENKRSKNLLKRKEFIDDEFIVEDVIEGDGNRAGTAGYMMLKFVNDDRRFKSNIKGSHAYLAQLLKDRKKLIGKKVTVRYFNLTPDEKVPRFPYVVAIRDYE